MPFRNYSYRSLELVCRKQAELSSTPEARKVLEVMAREYRAMADYLEKGNAASVTTPPADLNRNPSDISATLAAS